MSNIVIFSAYNFNTNKLSGYYSLAMELSKTNNVLYINTNHFIKNFKWGVGINKVDTKYYSQLVSILDDFQPDIIVSFMNNCPREIINRFPRLKSFLFLVDAPDLLHNKSDIAHTNFTALLSMLNERPIDAFLTHLPFFYVPWATTWSASSMTTYKDNISFLGDSYFTEYHRLNNTNFGRKLIYECYKLWSTDYNLEITQNTNDFFSQYNENDLDEARDYVKHSLLTGQKRLGYLSVLSDLGLRLYGTRWQYTLPYDYALYQCVDFSDVSEYNNYMKVVDSSKISININHAQAGMVSFSWRVQDIMASNSCILTEYNQEFSNRFQSYYTEETFNAITFKDRYEMRDKAIKLLKNEELRNMCIQHSHNAINKTSRWEITLKEIDNKYNLNLFNHNFDGYISFLNITKTHVINKHSDPNLKISSIASLNSNNADPASQRSIKNRIYRCVNNYMYLIYVFISITPGLRSMLPSRLKNKKTQAIQKLMKLL